MILPQRALSVRQPWAWAIIYARKDVENRDWRFGHPDRRFRGRACIHASLGMTRSEYEDGQSFLAQLGFTCPPAAGLVRGAIVGTVEVIDVVKDSDSPWYMGSRCGLVLRNPEPLLVPIPAAGKLGFFEWKATDGGKTAEPAKWMGARREEKGALL